MSQKFVNLFTGQKVGPLTLRNRIYFPPHGTGFVDYVNQQYVFPNERLGYYLAERASGGASLVFLDMQAYHPTSCYGANNHCSFAWMKEIVPRYQMIAKMVLDQGAYSFAQL